MCSLCDSTNINTIIEFVPNCLQHVSGDGFNGGSDSYLQFRDTCGKRRNINLILDVTDQHSLNVSTQNAFSLPFAAILVNCAPSGEMLNY